MGGRKPYGKADLDRLIAPRSFAVVGAAPREGSFGLLTLRNMARYSGRLWAVNPNYQAIEAVPCFASLSDLPDVPDAIAVSVPNHRVEAVIEEAAGLGVGGAIVYASGYGETGEAMAADREARLAEIAASSGLRIVGPNCMGLINVGLGAGMLFIPGFDELALTPGSIAVVSQSGALGYTLMQAMQRGVGFSHYLAPGNSRDVDISDFINYLVEDPTVAAIACLFEGVRDGGRLIAAARAALAADKPLVVCKIGRTEASRKVALSHTGSLIGDRETYDAVFAATGIVHVDDIEALLETTRFLARAGPPAARGVGALATSGGAAVIIADKAAEAGLALPAPAAATKAVLDQHVPAFGSTANPADVTAEVIKRKEVFEACADAMLADPGYGALVLPLVVAARATAADRAPLLARLSKRYGKPICVIWMNDWHEGPGSELFDAEETVVFFRSVRRTMAAIAAWHWRWSVREASLAAPDRVELPANNRARAIIAECDGALGEREAKDVLREIGIAAVGEIACPDADAAVEAAESLGFPVAVKLDSPDVQHKSELGVIRLGLTDAAAVREAADAVLAIARSLPDPPRVRGVLVQQMAPEGVEMMIGARLDRQFGPLVTVGLGGTAVEVLRDVCTALAPVDRKQAAAMIGALRALPLLEGFRGAPPADLAALADALCRLSAFVVELGDELVEIDVNPIIVGASGAIAADALIVTRGSAAGAQARSA